MIQKSSSKPMPRAGRSSNPRRDGLIILFAMVGLIVAGVIFSRVISFFELDNKVDVSYYPGSEKASLTAKGNSFIENKYTSDKPGSDYYKVSLTTDSCEKVFEYYRTEAGKSGWTIDRQGGTDGPNVQVDTYKKSSKGLFVYCVPGSEQLAENAGSKNTVIITYADTVLDLNPSTGETRQPYFGGYFGY